MAAILIADDDPAVLRLVTAILEGCGHRTSAAANGLEALMLYNSYSRDFDLVLSDIDMPEIDGIELADRITAMNPSAQVLLMTGCVPAGREPPSRYPVLCKPFRIDDLLKAVQDCLRMAGQ